MRCNGYNAKRYRDQPGKSCKVIFLGAAWGRAPYVAVCVA